MRFFRVLLTAVLFGLTIPLSAQLGLYVPNGTSGVTQSSTGNIGVGVNNPSYSLHAAGSIGVSGNQQFVARYNNSEAYKATFGWSHLQLGNNGPNWIVAGRTAQGGSLTFVVNNTADYAYNAFNGTAALHLSSAGNVGIGTTSPNSRLDVQGGILRVTDTLNGPPAFVEGHPLVAYFGAYQDQRASFGNSENWETISVDGGTAGVGQLADSWVRLAVKDNYPNITSSGINYRKAVDINAYGLPIAAGVTDSGYRIGLGVQAFVSDISFKGTLAYQYGIWARHGANISGTGSRINNSYGIYIETLTNAETAFDNLYGVFQSSSEAKNFFGGAVGIGTTNPGAHKLAVNGSVKAKEVIVETTGWSDHVFSDDYDLAPLSEVEAHIRENKHLPGIPSEQEVVAQGINVAEMQAMLLAKIEELTLHVIAQQKEIDTLKRGIASPATAPNE